MNIIYKRTSSTRKKTVLVLDDLNIHAGVNLVLWTMGTNVSLSVQFADRKLNLVCELFQQTKIKIWSEIRIRCLIWDTFYLSQI